MITFHTDKINKRFVRRVFENTIMHLGSHPMEFIKEWDIHVWGLEDTNIQFFEHIVTTSGQKINPNMPSGVTGLYRMDLYLHNSPNVFKLRENSDRIQHEICHALLLGTPQFVSGVHSMVNTRFKVSFWYWDRFKYNKFYLSIIDIRQWL